MLDLSKQLVSLLVYAVDALVMGGVAWWIFRLRQRERISMEAAALVLTGTIFAISPHIFPWYTTALLPWVVLLLRPLRTKGSFLHPAALAIALAWYFPCATISAYFLSGSYQNWTLYYVFVYGLVLAGFIVAAFLWNNQRKKTC